MTTQINIKNGLIADKDYLDSFVPSVVKTRAEALTHVITLSKSATSPEAIEAIHKEYAEELEKLDTEYKEMISNRERVLQDFERQITKLTETNQELTEESNRLKAEKEALTTLPPPSIDTLLKGNQFVCELPEEVTNEMRKVKSFAKKDGFIKPESEGIVYANDFVLVSVKSFLNRNYIDIITKKL
jgi:chromosome segregation ATPase